MVDGELLANSVRSEMFIENSLLRILELRRSDICVFPNNILLSKKHFTPTEFLESRVVRSYKHLTPNGV